MSAIVRANLIVVVCAQSLYEPDICAGLYFLELSNTVSQNSVFSLHSPEKTVNGVKRC